MATPSITSSIRWPVDLYDRVAEFAKDKGISFNMAVIVLTTETLDKTEGKR